MNYLLYIEHSAENLQFYLWHQHFVQRFKEATTSDLFLAPEWTSAMEADVNAKIQKEATENSRPEPIGTSDIFKDTGFEKKAPVDTLPAEASPFLTPPRTAASRCDRESTYAPSTHAPSTQLSNALTYRSQASEAFNSAGAQTPCE